MATLVIDVGSSSVRALLIDKQLNIIKDAFADLSYQFQTDKDGTSEIDARWLRQQVEGCIDTVLTHPAADKITEIGMATFVSNLLGVDGKAQPLTPVYTYADTRSDQDYEGLKHNFDIQAAYQRTGCPHHTAYHPTKLAWLKRTRQEIFTEVEQWIDFATYCYRVWFGADIPCSYSVASWTGLLNRHTLTWDSEWLKHLDIAHEKLPKLADFDTIQVGLNSEYSQRWQLLADKLFYLALGDGAAANIGSGGTENRQVVLTVGTTAALRMSSSAPPETIPKGLWQYQIDKSRSLIGGATTEGGNIAQWLSDTFGVSLSDFNSILADTEADSHGLTVLPLFAGERSPGYAIQAVGTIHGLTLSTSRDDIIRALFESVAIRLSMIAELIGSQARVPILAGGGAIANSPEWVQMMADAFGRPISALGESEVTARGVAALIQNQMNLASQPKIQQHFYPRREFTRLYQQARQRQELIYAQLYSNS